VSPIGISVGLGVRAVRIGQSLSATITPGASSKALPTGLSHIPYDAASSSLRMSVPRALSTAFTFVYGPRRGLTRPQTSRPGERVSARLCRQARTGTLPVARTAGNSASSGTRRKWSSPNIVSTSMMPARMNEAMAATRAICPKVPKA